MKYFLAIDFETSGLPHEGAQPVEIGAVLLHQSDLSPLDEFQSYIQHDQKRFTWSAIAENIHGLSREFLRESGLPLADVWGAFLVWLSRWIDLRAHGEIMLVGHNVPFDLRFLAILADCPPGVDIMPSWACYTARDTLQWASLIAQAQIEAHGFEAAPFRDPETGRPSLSLDAIASSLDIDRPEAHSALADARVTAQVMQKLVSHLVEDLRNSRKYTRRRAHIEKNKFS
jgi:DNA polymerase III epsilon subunit-like protein